jgi:hypothetical protein
MKKAQKANSAAARRRARLKSRTITWAIVAAVVALVGFGLANVSNIAYDEDDIAAVRFDSLTRDQKQEALEAANTARCTCGCGMTLAQCVATDMTCPVREGNIERIKAMVREAQSTPAS